MQLIDVYENTIKQNLSGSIPAAANCHGEALEVSPEVPEFLLCTQQPLVR